VQDEERQLHLPKHFCSEKRTRVQSQRWASFMWLKGFAVEGFLCLGFLTMWGN
jgi:hypothetical protein